MSDNIHQISAFAVYAAKRKSTEQSRDSKNPKIRCLGKDNAASTQKNLKRINGKQALTKQKLKTQPETKIKLRKTASNTNKLQQETVLNNNHNKHKIVELQAKKEKNEKNDCTDETSGKMVTNDLKVSTKDHIDPVTYSAKVFKWLIYPQKVNSFISNNWEQTSLHIKRNDPSYYSKVMSTPLLHQILKNNTVLFHKEIDIVNYVNGVREDHNPDEGRALPSVVWNYYDSGCSVRMCNPEAYVPQLHKLSATLQEVFNCSVRSNWYLTPPNSQGFAPHYDDVEAFILQIEGKKRWKLYKPRSENEYLPRYSSENFDQSEIGEPILDTIVDAGDLLYLPRGTIHQAMTIDNSHSLHLTLSVYQKNSYHDFLSKLLPHALERATEVDISFRKGLPVNYLKYCGFAHPDSEQKRVFKESIKNLIVQMIDHIDVDRTADLMAKDHIHDFYPPALTDHEKQCSVVRNGATMKANGIVENITSITLDTKMRLVRYHCISFVKEDDGSMRLYYSTENSMKYHEYEQQFFEFDEKFVHPMTQIIKAYPQFICVSSLTGLDDDSKIQFVSDLWEKNIIVTDVPLDSVSK
ncbi:bifunctional lysine-specific demethylase and histidyl-hydroxylase NO66 [Pseudomyrmex gracilis]|uniref:bifunctional lysine-specific demethylase and histidyl-hydroxylase NO66 n=1 Tax=Pseudomyrmex gracilis TaxID=219809 RepID=UPI0009955C72|nr:bifunctional lysine-specific demethylase and histidyl-hydroxylase NO66 [Pseudomyrmex gracilis]